MTNETMQRSAEQAQRNLSTADLAAAAEPREDEREIGRSERAATRSSGDGEQLAPLFANDVANDFRARWNDVQAGFVDDPRQAVRRGDELVAQVMKSLAESFANERKKLESEIDERHEASTEDLRVTLRRYRSFFERLLSV